MRWKWSRLKPEPPEIFPYVVAMSVLAWEWGLLMQLDAASTRLEATVAELVRARGVAIEP